MPAVPNEQRSTLCEVIFMMEREKRRIICNCFSAVFVPISCKGECALVFGVTKVCGVLLCNGLISHRVEGACWSVVDSLVS